MSKNFNDPLFLAGFRDGDREAFKEMYLDLYDGLLLFAYSIVRKEDVAKDIVAEGFLKLWERRKHMSSFQHIRSFLFLTTRNACLNHLRSEKRHEVSHARIRYTLREGESGAEEAMILAELLKVIYLRAQQLPRQCRQVFHLLFVEGLEAWEVAEQLGLSVYTVYNHRARALEILRDGFRRGRPGRSR